MPELPEMQALAERLHEATSGASFVRIMPLQFSAAKTFDPPAEALVGRQVERVWRRGKYVIFETGGPRLVFHLSQGGRVDLEDPPKATKPKGAVLRLVLDRAPAILMKEFGTQRKAGWWVLSPADDGPLERLGPEPFSPEFEALILGASEGRRIHTLLRDQRFVAGIGRGYVDEILHAAQLSPYASLSSLTALERRHLIEAVGERLEAGLALERQRTGGLPTKLEGRFAIHGRHGLPCPRCGDDMRRVSYESYEVTYCPRCQTGGKVLADRRMSRLVR